MYLRTTIATLVLCLFAALPAWAGPPLLCHPIPIGSAPSLPWSGGYGWNGMDSSYDVSHLIADTLKFLTPATPLPAREETLRRAAIYSTRQSGLAETLASRLLARATDAQTRGLNEPSAWFDAGYFAATVREAARVYAMTNDPVRRSGWFVRAPVPNVDASALIRKAISLGGKNMEGVAAIAQVDQSRP